FIISDHTLAEPGGGFTAGSVFVSGFLEKMTSLASNEQTPRYRTSGFLFAGSAILLFSLKPIFIKLAYEYPIDSVTLMTLRMGFSLPLYILIGIYLLVKKRIDPVLALGTLPKTIMTGMLGYYGASYFDLTGLHYISAQLERLILFSYPSLVVILGYFFFKTPIQGGTIPALLLTYTGILALFVHDISLSGQAHAFGGVLVFIGAVLFSLYILFSKSVIDKIGSMAFTCIAMTAASIAILLHFSISRELSDLHQPMPVYLAAFAIAMLSTVLPSFLISEAINRIGTNATSIIGSSGALVTSVLAVGILGEDFTPYHVIALVLVTSGIVWLGRAGRR
ncbi:MAG: DMT family transporter, partial [Gammaproteobacteria bacterium]|nr:DMT family transporter [Gammaproteobacteria bacterium]